MWYIFTKNNSRNPDYKNEDKYIKNFKWKELQLQGYSSDNVALMRHFDKSLDGEDVKSKYIHFLNVTNDEVFQKNCETLSDEEMCKIVNNVEAKIKEGAKNIFDNDFRIEPKKIGKNDRSCIYCPYESICYKKAQNYKYISIDKTKGDEEDD